MRLLLLSAALLAALPVGTALAARCTADTITSASFEVTSGARIAGKIGGLDAATVDVLHRGASVATGNASAGAFSIDLPPLAPESMLTLRVRGLEANGQSFVELGSHLGTVDQLVDTADGDGVTRIAGVPGLAVSAESTARFVLAEQALPEGVTEVAHECHLARLQATIDADEQRRIAAVIKILIEDGIPAAIAATSAKGTSATTTLELVQDEAQFEQTVDTIETESPGRIAAVQSLLAESFCGYFTPEAILLYQPRALGLEMNTSYGGIYQTVDAQNGTHVDGFGRDAYTFTCSNDILDAQFAGERVSVSFPFRTVNGSSVQVRQEYRVRDNRVTRIDSNPDFITVALRVTTVNSYPFTPELADEVRTDEARLVLLREAPGTPFDAATLPGEYLAPTSGQAGDLTANRISLQEGGTGTDLDSDAALSWQVTDGDLLIQFTDRTIRLIPLRDEAANVSDVVVVANLPGGERRVSEGLLLRRTATPFWNNIDTVPGRYTQHSGRVSSAPFRVDLAADRSAPAFSGESLSFTFHWSRPQAGQIVLRICENFDGTTYSYLPLTDREPVAGECNSWYRRRTWTAYTIDGDRYYIHEHNEDWYGDAMAGQNPANFVFSRGIHYQYAPPLTEAKQSASIVRHADGMLHQQ